MPDTNDDQELHAIQQIVTALSELDSGGARPCHQLCFPASGDLLACGVERETGETRTGLAESVEGAVAAVHQARRQMDMRTFGHEKNPRSADARVAVVGYYLAELAAAEGAQD